jgi:HK97 gp10 family phage protein
MKTTVRIEGLRELDATLGALGAEFGKPAAKAVLRRVGVKALTPMAETARALAPDDPETGGKDLKASITVGTRLNKRQSAMARKDQSKSTTTAYMGPTVPWGLYQEFGTVHHSPQPFMRPAFQQHAEPTIRSVGTLLWPEIENTATRLARRRAARAA